MPAKLGRRIKPKGKAITRTVAGVPTARQAIRTRLEAFEIYEVTRRTLQHAETLSGNDFEDNLQIACATLQNMDAIITRDKAGFQNLSIAVFDPADLLAQL